MHTELIVISYNTAELTLGCIRTALELGGVSGLGVCVVDNGSSDGSPDRIRESYPEARVIENCENLGYAKACNIGGFSSKAETIILSNSDIEYREGSISKLVAALSDKSYGIVGPQQFFARGTFQRSAGFAPGLVQSVFDLGPDKVYRNLCWNMGLSPQYQNGYIDGGVLAFRKEVYEELGGMDEDFFFYTEEADLCYRAAKQGYKNETLREAEVVHFRGSSSDANQSEESHEEALKKSLWMLVSSKKLFMKKHRSGFNRWLTILVEKLNYGLRYFLSSKGISIVPDKKTETYRILYEAWKGDEMKGDERKGEAR